MIADTAAWNHESVLVLESNFTPGASDEWHAWNEWSPEREVADFLPVLAGVIDAAYVVETGVGQGYASRRLAAGNWYLRAWESDDELRAALLARPVAFVQDTPSPSFGDLLDADLVVLDSDPPLRVQEFKLWLEHGRIGSWCFLHDANKRANPSTGYWQLWKVAQMTGLPMWEFDNPRGSVLLYKAWAPRIPITVAASEKPKPVKSGVQGKGSVFVAQLDPGEVSGNYAHSMARMIAYTMQWPGVFGGYVRHMSGPRVWHSRDAIVRHFLYATECDWLLQIDSDMDFKWDLLERLLSSADVDERPIVAGHCYMLRGESGPLPTMWTLTDKDELLMFEGYPEGLVPVVGTGAACILIHRRVFEKLRDAFPDHPYPWYEETIWQGKPVGEDLTFCLRARSHGIPTYVDTTLDIGHVKQIVVDKSYFADWRRVRRTIVTGLPGPHLEWVANLLRRAGVSAGYEWVFKKDGVEPWGNRWVDVSSWVLPQVQRWEGPSIFIASHPARTVPHTLAVYAANAATLLVRAETLDVADLAKMLEVCRAPAVQHPNKLAEYLRDCPRPDMPIPETDDPEVRRIAAAWGYSV